MWLRLYSFVLLLTLSGLSAVLVWLLQLPTQPGFVYNNTDPRYNLLEYADFVFLVITTLTIVLIIGRPSFQAAQQKESAHKFDRVLYTFMFNLPLILICMQCALILLGIFVASLRVH